MSNPDFDAQAIIAKAEEQAERFRDVDESPRNALIGTLKGHIQIVCEKAQRLECEHCKNYLLEDENHLLEELNQQD